MNILALETSTDACSVALIRDNALFEKHQMIPQQHARVILDWMTELLAEGDISLDAIDVLAYSAGPGGFTGIRISAAIVKSIALAKNKPIIPVSSLQVIAQGAYREFKKTKIMVLLDARMGQAYLGTYMLGEMDLMTPINPDQIFDIASLNFQQQDTKDFLLITNLETHSHLWQDAEFSGLVTNYDAKAYDVAMIAHHLFKQGKISTLNEANPIYLRGEDAWKKI